MAAGRASFEVQISRDGRWYLGATFDTEESARAACKGFLTKPGSQGVRLLKSWERSDGSSTENVLYTEMREQKEVKATIVAIETANYCQSLSDYYNPASRGTISRLCRKYLEQACLTPTELIHSGKALKRIQEADSFFPSAVGHVAGLQAKSENLDSKARGEEIFKAVEKITERARKVETRPDLPKLKNDDFDKLVEAAHAIAPAGHGDYYSLVALSRNLGEQRSWLGKLDLVSKLMRPDQQQERLALLDGVVADLIATPQALQDMLGDQRNLAEAICVLADFHEGRFTGAQSDAREQIGVISPFLAKGKLDQTRAALLERVVRQLGGTQPLNRSEPEREREAIRAVALRLYRPEGLIGGGETAEALTRRYRGQLEEGGAKGLRLAMGGMISLMNDSLFTMNYLHALAESPAGEELMPEIQARLVKLIGEAGTDELAPPRLPLKERLLRLSRLYEKMTRSTLVTPEEKARLVSRFDDLLANFVINQRILEKLDDPAVLLRDRAPRLIEFCAANVLPAGSKALDRVRQHVVEILRQPNFELHFIEGITDPVRIEQMLRGFHALLVRAGFKR